jgi:hypothetical protein
MQPLLFDLDWAAMWSMLFQAVATQLRQLMGGGGVIAQLALKTAQPAAFLFFQTALYSSCLVHLGCSPLPRSTCWDNTAWGVHLLMPWMLCFE